MSTSDQQGDKPLTRKQLREIRLTGATPVITEEQATTAAAAPPRPAKPVTVPPAPQPVTPQPVTPQPEPAADSAGAPLTRRQARAQERVRTASVPVIEPAPDAQPPVVQPVPAAETVVAPKDAEPVVVAPVAEPAAVEDEDLTDEIVDVAPVSAAAAVEAVDAGEPLAPAVVDADDEDDAVAGLSALGVEVSDDDDDDDDAGDELPIAEPVATGEHAVVSPGFGQDLLGEKSDVPAFTPSFDDLLTSDSGGSQSAAPNTLIFTPSPGEGSLSGPVASTGELLVTGSYELPQGIGSQGHAHGAADGKEADAVLIDGELPPASSPTPIAASAAVSTIKPAAEVIRPPAPEKGNKLMMTLAITAGGLALALAVALIVAFSTNVFG